MKQKVKLKGKPENDKLFLVGFMLAGWTFIIFLLKDATLVEMYDRPVVFATIFLLHIVGFNLFPLTMIFNKKELLITANELYYKSKLKGERKFQVSDFDSYKTVYTKLGGMMVLYFKDGTSLIIRSIDFSNYHEIVLYIRKNAKFK
ncbi:hypothetical protein [Aureibacter tunicatorum]|uniref:Uncharacterized protein n=1 Tax=Aureibacter tunicatorum TaxID=866807 RepID=A0AAE3XN91_9BACT|nr:hypothetical protein [Aureibacter tunicatorum]MDR6240077.1 hypothetical protein [Aureibacter tunicatorum]BDD04548.1 hypothetical protein AUTU_20310 [Aureibacter tunicatorum]